MQRQQGAKGLNRSQRWPFQLVPVIALAIWDRLPKVWPFQAKPSSALHPVGPFLADPNRGVEVFWLLGSVFEPHQVARRVFASGRRKSRLGPAQDGAAAHERGRL